MAWIVVSRIYLYTNGEGEVGMVVSSVDIVMFSFDPDCIFVEGEITRNKVSLGL